MHMSRRTFCKLAALAAVPGVARAAIQWPAKPIVLLVPGGPGGVTDVRARWLAPRLSTIVGQPVVVENKPGAGGVIGTTAGARAPADGYTITVVHQGTMAINPHIYKDLPYDPLRDFMPLTRAGMGSLALVTNPSLGYRTLEDFIAGARKRATPLSYGSPGIGTPPHIAAEFFLREADIRAIHIPFKGGGQAASDLIAGHVDFSVEGLTVTTPHVQAGRLVALAVTGGRRSDALPDVPTMREAGLPNYRFEGWVGLAAPRATPAPVIAQMHAALAQVLNTPESKAWFAAAGAEPAVVTPEEFIAFIAEENARLGPVIRGAGIRAE